jgi:hypothetical protein
MIFPVGKRSRCVGLTTLPPSCTECRNSGSLNLLDPKGVYFQHKNEGGSGFVGVVKQKPQCEHTNVRLRADLTSGRCASEVVWSRNKPQNDRQFYGVGELR